MPKLATLAALLVALLALAEATTYTTVTTTTVDEETTNPQSCQKQQMSHCRMYLQCQQGGRGSQHESLRMVVNTRCEERHLQQCCDQLSNIHEECRCQAIKKMVMEQGTEQMQGMMQQAQDLPRQCNMQPQKCDMRAVWF